MPNPLEVLRHASRLHGHATRQRVTAGVIVGFEAGRYRVTSGQATYDAVAGIAETLNIGDRVQIIQGHGITKIIGLLGADENA